MWLVLSVWKTRFQRIDCIIKGPDANNINSNIAVESAEKTWHQKYASAPQSYSKLTAVAITKISRTWFWKRMWINIRQLLSTSLIFCWKVLFYLFIHICLTQGKLTQISLWILVQVSDNSISSIFDILKCCMFISKVGLITEVCAAWIVVVCKNMFKNSCFLFLLTYSVIASHLFFSFIFRIFWYYEEQQVHNLFWCILIFNLFMR